MTEDRRDPSRLRHLGGRRAGRGPSPDPARLRAQGPARPEPDPGRKPSLLGTGPGTAPADPELTNAGLNLEGVRRVLELGGRGGPTPARVEAPVGAREAVAVTHRQYRRDLVPLSPAAVPTRTDTTLPARRRRIPMSLESRALDVKTQEAFAAAVERARGAYNAEVTSEPPAGRHPRPDRRDRRSDPGPGGGGARRRPRPEQRPARPPAPSLRRGRATIDRRLRDVLEAADRPAWTWVTSTSRSSTSCWPWPTVSGSTGTSCSPPSATCGAATGSPRRTPRRRSRPSRSTDGT